jgi:hypothetical protein
VLWVCLRIDLVDTEERKLSEHFHPYCKGVFTNVKRPTVTTHFEDVQGFRVLEAFSNLVGLPSTLPQDSLTCFASHSFRMDHNLLSLPLQTHSQVNNLCRDS